MNTIKGKIIAVLVGVVIAAVAYTAGTGTFFAPKTASAASNSPLYNQDTVTSIYNNASPAVVEIDTTQQSGNGILSQATEGEGSGIVLDPNGDILTNNHVVSGATSVTVKFISGKTVTAKVLGTDPIKDLAVINVGSAAVAGITPLNLDTNMNDVQVGQMAIAIGNPYGYDDTLTVGVISGLNRTINGSNYTGMLQTDAALNPGNSGGPLLDANGTVIGINTAIESNATGIGFAIPSAVAYSELSSLEAGQAVQHAWIGITGETLTSSLAKQYGISAAQGVYVVSVVSGSPAQTAGLKGGNYNTNGQPVGGGDVITAVDGNPVNTIQDLKSYIDAKSVGEPVTLTVLRGGNTTQIQVTLGAMPSNLNSSSTPNEVPQTQQTPSQGNGNHGYYFRLPGGGYFGFNSN